MRAKQPEQWLCAIFMNNIAINIEKILGELKVGFVGKR